jgi:hypothetical protein
MAPLAFFALNLAIFFDRSAQSAVCSVWGSVHDFSLNTVRFFVERFSVALQEPLGLHFITRIDVETCGGSWKRGKQDRLYALNPQREARGFGAIFGRRERLSVKSQPIRFLHFFQVF